MSRTGRAVVVIVRHSGILNRDTLDRGNRGCIARIRTQRLQRPPAAHALGAPRVERGGFQLIQQLGRGLRRVAYEDHVAARCKRGFGALHHAAGDARALHRQVVAEDHAAEAEPASEHVLQPHGRESGRPPVHLRINHVSRHDSAQTPFDQLAVRQQVGGFDLAQFALVHWDIDVRVRLHVAVTGKMLADRCRAAGRRSGDERAGERRDHRGLVRERTISDDAARAEVYVEYGRETEIDSVRPQLHRDDVTRRFREGSGLRRVGFPALPEQTHRRDAGKPFLEALHPPALMVHRDERLAPAQSANLGREREELPRGLEVAREQDHAAHRGMTQYLLLLRRNLRPGYIEHHRAERHLFLRAFGAAPSTTTNAQAMPISSVSDTWTLSTPRRLRNAARGPENLSEGFPERSFSTQTPCQLAAKRLARYAARLRWRRKRSSSEATRILSAKRSPKRSRARSIRPTSQRSVPIPRITMFPSRGRHDESPRDTGARLRRDPAPARRRSTRARWTLPERSAPSAGRRANCRD